MSRRSRIFFTDNKSQTFGIDGNVESPWVPLDD